MGEDRNYRLYPRYRISTPALLGLLPRVLRRLEKSYDNAICHLMRKELEIGIDAISKKDKKWMYATDWGTVQLSEDHNVGKEFVVLADKALQRSEFKAGHLALAILRTIQKTMWSPAFIELEYVLNNRPRKIAELFEVNVDARLGSEHAVLLEDALPLRYTNRLKISESDRAITALEQEAMAALREKAGNKHGPVTIETKIANVWHESYGVLPGFWRGRRKAPGQPSTRLYRYETLTLPDAGHTGTSPRSGEAQSP